MTAIPPEPDGSPRQGPALVPSPPALQTSAGPPPAGPRSESKPGPLVTDPDVTATVRLLHRRQGWGRAAVTSFIAFLLGAGASSSAQSQGTPQERCSSGFRTAVSA